MHRLLGGLIFAVANSPVLALNFYPLLGELGSVTTRLAKMCKWSTILTKMLQDNCKPMIQTINHPDKIYDWLDTVEDKVMATHLRLFIHQFVPVPANFHDPNILKQEW